MYVFIKELNKICVTVFGGKVGRCNGLLLPVTAYCLNI